MISAIYLMVAAIIFIGCATITGGTFEGVVAERAKFDLECDSVEVKNIGGSSFGAVGCGKRASYSCVQSDALTKTCARDDGFK